MLVVYPMPQLDAHPVEIYQSFRGSYPSRYAFEPERALSPIVMLNLNRPGSRDFRGGPIPDTLPK